MLKTRLFRAEIGGGSYSLIMAIFKCLVKYTSNHSIKRGAGVNSRWRQKHVCSHTYVTANSLGSGCSAGTVLQPSNCLS